MGEGESVDDARVSGEGEESVGLLYCSRELLVTPVCRTSCLARLEDVRSCPEALTVEQQHM